MNPMERLTEATVDLATRASVDELASVTESFRYQASTQEPGSELWTQAQTILAMIRFEVTLRAAVGGSSAILMKYMSQEGE